MIRCCIDFGRSMVVVVIDGRCGDSTTGTSGRDAVVVRFSWKAAGRTPVAAVWLSVVSGAAACCRSGFLPGSRFMACCPITILPEVEVNTGNRLTLF